MIFLGRWPRLFQPGPSDLKTTCLSKLDRDPNPIARTTSSPSGAAIAFRICRTSGHALN